MERIVILAEEGKVVGGEIDTKLENYSGLGYVTNLNNDGDYIEVTFHIQVEGYYQLYIRQASLSGERRNLLYIDDECYGEFMSKQSNSFEEAQMCTIFFKVGTHKIKVVKFWGEINVDSFILTPTDAPLFIKPTFELSNKKASDKCKQLMNFFNTIYGKQIITGQHTAAANGPELEFILNTTGNLPAIRGFDFLSYSHATVTENPSQHKIVELEENEGSVEKAIEWATSQNGIVTFCWHWYAPTGGRDKSFYTEKTTFDLNVGLTAGTKENIALLNDLDAIAYELKKLQDEDVPVLWRPLHEADGGWFWWGAKGPEAYKKLYHLMYDRYTNYHQLHNLIWVWNAPNPDWYPGDAFVDIAGMDTYVPSGQYGPLKLLFDVTFEITKREKPVALTENGAIPDPDLLITSKTPWLWYMTWYGDFVFDGKSTSIEHLTKVYNHHYCITLKDLPSFN